jgi:DNA-binding NtrC family response regulator
MSAASALLARNAGDKILVASSRAEFRRRVLRGLSQVNAHADAQENAQTAANADARSDAHEQGNADGDAHLARKGGTLRVAPGVEAAGGADALLKLENADFRTLMIDPQLDDLDFDELLALIHVRYPGLRVIVLDADGSLPDFIAQQPIEPKAAPRAADLEALGITPLLWDEPPETRIEQRKVTPALAEPLPGMIGTSRKMQQLYRLARLVAPRDTAVLIVGNTGTGKELVARGIHELSRRSRGPLIVVNCAAIPETLLEAELFGFTRGAFTGAVQSRLGRIHAAHGGTLFLDEVGELPMSMQAKLLRFVQEGEVQRLGSADLFRVDARLIAATNANLLQRVREKQFREDLYYRLAVFPIELPALRERPEDILPLAQHFLASLCGESGVPRKIFSAEASNILRQWSWPGNVRELHHAIERAFVLADSNVEISDEDLLMHAETP